MGRGCHWAPTSLIQAARSDCRGQATVTVWPARVPASARERTALAHPPSVGWETWRIRKRRHASADGTSGSRAEVLLMRGGSLLCASGDGPQGTVQLRGIVSCARPVLLSGTRGVQANCQLRQPSLDRRPSDDPTSAHCFTGSREATVKTAWHHRSRSSLGLTWPSVSFQI